MPVPFGDYTLSHKLAEGGMAEVFLARKQGPHGFDKPVVVKRILPHLEGEPQFVEMFMQEARIAARLSHPSIAQVFDFGCEEGQHFIAMEYVHGEDLRHLAKGAERARRRPEVPLVARVIADVLGALHYAHTRKDDHGRPLGLVHRDVSPQNVLVTFDGGVKLVDFGIAKATAAPGLEQTQAGLLKGKYAYMSPEQARGQPLDARSDVFSAGILLWELLTWRRLFRRDNDLGTLVAVADEPVPLVSSLRPDVPPELDRIAARALTRPLAKRYASAQAMQADLETLIRSYGWEADSIAVGGYMREVFADRLSREDEVVRAAGAASVVDVLARDEDATQLLFTGEDTKQTPPPLDVWGDGPEGDPGADPAQAASPDDRSDAVDPLPSEATRLFAGAPAAAPFAATHTDSTLLHAVGESQPPPPVAPGRSVWRGLALAAVAVVASVAIVVGARARARESSRPSVIGAAGSPRLAPGPPNGPPGNFARVHVVLDGRAAVLVDGQPRAELAEGDIDVTPGVSHELRLQIHGRPAGPPLTLPPLLKGETRTVRKSVLR